MPFLFQIQFTNFSVLWILVSLLIGLSYSFLLYRRKSELPVSLVRTLFALRTLTVAFIAFLLFAPLVKTENKTVEKPIIFILLDNSASIAISQAPGFNLNTYKTSIQNLIGGFGEDYEIKALSIGNKTSSYSNLTFQDKATDLSSAFKQINERYSNRNIGAIILATDGIYNRGSNPQYEALNIKAPVYTIALGDTIPKKDLLIANVNYNNIVYSGNDFQIEVLAEAFQCKGVNARITISANKTTLFTRNIPIQSNEQRTTLPITLPARQKGIQKFTVSISPVTGELSKENNSYTFFVEVIDGKQKVYILANSPHPDISALKQSIESNKNYEVKTGFAGSFNKEDVEKANLLILHQLPSANLQPSALNELTKNKSTWYITGDQTNTSLLSASQNLLNIVSNGTEQEAFASFNSSFYDFVLTEATRKKIQDFAPLLTPFGSYAVKGDASVLINQQIGKLATDRPLLLFSKTENHKTALLCGEGIWKWRLEDFRENSSHQAVDELVSKTVQYLSSKEDKRKFRVYPAKNTFDESEHVILNGELYNNSYELVNTPDVRTTIKSNSGKSYSFAFSRTENTYILDAGILPSGEYSFKANTKLGENALTAEGKFIVSRQLEEYRQTTANHQILDNLASQSNGKLIYPDQIGSLAQTVKQNEFVKAISFENRKYEDLIDLKALFGVLLILLSLEWFSRKRNGEI